MRKAMGIQIVKGQEKMVTGCWLPLFKCMKNYCAKCRDQLFISSRDRTRVSGLKIKQKGFILTTERILNREKG